MASLVITLISSLSRSPINCHLVVNELEEIHVKLLKVDFIFVYSYILYTYNSLYFELRTFYNKHSPETYISDAMRIRGRSDKYLASLLD